MTGDVVNEASQQNFNYQKIVLVVTTVMMTIKFIAWLITDSVSIFTDALDSIVNVIAAIICLYALYLSSKPRDMNHPFGHGKVEIISSTVEGTMIFIAGVTVIFEAVNRMFNPDKQIMSLDIGVILIAVTAIMSYIVGYYAVSRGRANGSSALIASGKHLCSDTYSSIGIIIGLTAIVISNKIGYDAYWFDGVIACIFGTIIIITGVKIIKKSLDSTMDKADMEIVDEILKTLKTRRHSHWIDIHNLRVIRFGTTLHIQMHVVFPKSITIIDQSHEINELRKFIEDVRGNSIDLIIMGDPCTDVMCPLCDRGCNDRKHKFDRFKEWTIETISGEDTSL